LDGGGRWKEGAAALTGDGGRRRDRWRAPAMEEGAAALAEDGGRRRERWCAPAMEEGAAARVSERCRGRQARTTGWPARPWPRRWRTAAGRAGARARAAAADRHGYVL
jgi:hypothetical protein